MFTSIFMVMYVVGLYFQGHMSVILNYIFKVMWMILTYTFKVMCDVDQYIQGQ